MKKKLSLEKMLREIGVYQQARMYEKNGIYFAFLFDDKTKKLIKKVSENKSDIIKFVLPTVNRSWQLQYKNISNAE